MRILSFLILVAVTIVALQIYRRNVTVSFITGGTDAPPEKYKFFAGLHVRGFGLICGGTLIHPSVVLTAAHCRNFGMGNFPLFMFHVEIQGESFSIKSAKTHPNFDVKQPQLGNDLVLLYLSHPVPNPNTTIVKLNSDTAVPSLSNLLSVAGFGLTEPHWSARPKRLQQVTDLLSVNCTQVPEPWFHDDNHDMICTRSGLSRANVCTFDSGSPLLLLEESEEMVQVGITSIGDAGTNPGCSTLYAGFTAIVHYYEWIQSNLPSRME
mmetsp:Transcript_26576/g.40213  ORF Transcript_26576/g.40213 Transcript_26576/m.40213 type:complete len:266 (+) Transcript_26576:212-1009(+)